MKKTDIVKEDLFEYAIGFVFIAIMFLIAYLEKKYDVTKYIWIFNIGAIVFMPLYYFINNYKEKMNTKKLENKIIIKNIDFEYYRDIIDEYSPAILSFILDGLEFDKDLGASVIYLINKGYLELQDQNKIVRTNKDDSKLSEDLKILCNSDINHLLACTRLKTKTIKEEVQASQSGKTRRKWLSEIEKQVVEKGLVTEKKEHYGKTMGMLLIAGVIEALFAMCIESYGLLFFSGIVIYLLMFLRFWAFDENKFVKTQKGYELYTKVVGLKNYIKDYSNLSESELKEIAIWEDYSIYAIILNNSSKLNKEAMDFYKKVCNIRDEENIQPKTKKSIKISTILSVSVIFVAIISVWREWFLTKVAVILIVLNSFLIKDGKNCKKIITIIIHIFNIIFLVLEILYIIGF